MSLVRNRPSLKGSAPAGLAWNHVYRKEPANLGFVPSQPRACIVDRPRTIASCTSGALPHDHDMDARRVLSAPESWYGGPSAGESIPSRLDHATLVSPARSEPLIVPSPVPHVTPLNLIQTSCLVRQPMNIPLAFVVLNHEMVLKKRTKS